MDGMESTASLLKQIQQQLNSTKGLDKLAPAFVKAWAEIGTGVVKDSSNPHIGNNYASLGAVLDLIKPVFAKYGLALIQSQGEIDGTKVRLPFHLLHESGQSMGGFSEMPAMGPARKDGSVMPMTAQTIGSAITYGRRYQAMALAGIAPVDDDGNAASGQGEPEETPQADKDAFLEKLAKCETKADTDDLRTELESLNDKACVEAWSAKRKELRGKK